MRYIVIRKFTLDTVLMNIAMFCVFSFALLEHSGNAISFVSSAKFPLLFAGAFCLALLARVYFTKLTTKKYFYTFFLLFTLIVLLVWIMLVNRNSAFGDSTVRGTLRLILYLIDLFVLVVVAAERGQGQNVLRFLFRYMVVLAIINDVLMFTRLITFGSGKYESFVVGSKFSASYLHMNLLTLWMLNNKKTIRSYRFSLWKILLAAAFIITVSIRVNCMTGILGCVLLVVLFVLIESPSRGRLFRFTTPGMLLLFLAGSVVFAFVAEAVLSIPFLIDLVENVFGRDISLTGRTYIYAQYIRTIPEHWLTGYGYGNANAVTSTLFGYDNVQNALLQWVLQIGIVATAALILLMLHIFSKISWNDTENMPKILLLVSLIYMYIILGTIETTINMAFIMWFALIFMLVNERKAAPSRRWSASES